MVEVNFVKLRRIGFGIFAAIAIWQTGAALLKTWPVNTATDTALKAGEGVGILLGMLAVFVIRWTTEG